MSSKDGISKSLGTWLGKAKKVGEPPLPSAVRDTLSRPETARGVGTDGLVQLNFKIAPATKKRVKQLAARDNITLLVMFDRMLELYEREYGRLGK
jgi:hypothetical protein